MVRDEVLDILHRRMPGIRALGVASLAVFGSCVRGEERPDSDVDILVEFETPVSIFKFLDVKEYLEALLGRPVDLVMRGALKPQLRERTPQEAVSAT